MAGDQGVRPVALCRADAVAEGQGRGFRLGTGAQQVAVFVIRTGGVLRGYVNSCPHAGTPLDWLPDRFFDRSGTHSCCAARMARCSGPSDGLCLRGPCAGKRLAPAPISVVDGEIMLMRETL